MAGGTAADARAAVAPDGGDVAAADDDRTEIAAVAAADARAAVVALPAFLAGGGRDRAAVDGDRAVSAEPAATDAGATAIATSGDNRTAVDRDVARSALHAAANACGKQSAAGQDRAAIDRNRPGRGGIAQAICGCADVATAANAGAVFSASGGERAAVHGKDAAGLPRVAADAGLVQVRAFDDERTGAAALAPDRQAVRAGQMDAIWDGERDPVAEDQVDGAAYLDAVGNRHVPHHRVPTRVHGRRGTGDRRKVLAEQLAACRVHVCDAYRTLEGGGQRPVSVGGEAVNWLGTDRLAILRPAEEGVAGGGHSRQRDGLATRVCACAGNRAARSWNGTGIDGEAHAVVGLEVGREIPIRLNGEAVDAIRADHDAVFLPAREGIALCGFGDERDRGARLIRTCADDGSGSLCGGCGADGKTLHEHHRNQHVPGRHDEAVPIQSLERGRTIVDFPGRVVVHGVAFVRMAQQRDDIARHVGLIGIHDLQGAMLDVGFDGHVNAEDGAD